VVKTSTSLRSPLSPTRSPDDAFPWWGSLALAGALFVATIVALAGVVGVLVSLNLATTKDFRGLSWPIIILQFASIGGPLAVLIPGLPALAKRSLGELGLHAPRVSDVPWAFGGAAGMFIVATVIGALQEAAFHVKADQVTVHWLRDARVDLVAGLVVLACIGAPVVEELTFRGFVFNAILRYSPAWLAVALSGLLFGLAHAQTGAGSIAPLAAAGMVLAVVYYRSRSLTASILAHATFNAFTVVVVLGLHQG